MRTKPTFREQRPLVLDFDNSVLPLGKNEIRISLEDWQEAIRFGCSWRAFFRLENHLRQALTKDYSCVFTGSGDFHHLTLFLLRELERRESNPEPVDLVVLDNHPDNMRYPFGLHCGSWVSSAAAMSFVRHVHVIGICSSDITLAHAWENRLTPFFRRKLTYWSVGKSAGWLRLVGQKDACRTFSFADALIDAFLPVANSSPRIYFSLDKDVLDPTVVRTNWDQGVFMERHLTALIAACRKNIVGADICGDVSEHVYKSRFKRLLARLDGQRAITPQQVRAWQEQQRNINARLLSLLVED